MSVVRNVLLLLRQSSEESLCHLHLSFPCRENLEKYMPRWRENWTRELEENPLQATLDFQ